MLNCINIVPVGNAEPLHTVGSQCWCFPVLSAEGSGLMLTHNAKDCREKFERQQLVNEQSSWVLVNQVINA